MTIPNVRSRWAHALDCLHDSQRDTVFQLRADFARFENTHPSQVVETSRAKIGSFDQAQRVSARLFIRTRQFDHFFRLGVYRR